MPDIESKRPGIDTSPVVLALAGSLRRHSYNKLLLAAANMQAESALSIRIYEDLASVPLFNEDLEEQGLPDGVARLATALAAADALLISTPEYNQGLPGVLKNAIDWLSRCEPDLLDAKPTAVLGASAGPWGTRLAQAALRHTLAACGAIVMPSPQIYVSSAADVFDSNGALTDERIRDSLAAFVSSFHGWIEWPRMHRRDRILKSRCGSAGCAEAPH